MSAAAETALQVGIQSAIGTPIAATRKIYGVAGFPNEDDNHGTVTQSRPSYQAVHDVLETHKSASWKYEEVLNFHEVMFWMHTFGKGSITPAGAGPYTWTINSEDTTAFDVLTVEAGDNIADVRMPDAINKSWEIIGEDGHGPKSVMLKLDFLGSKVDDMAGGITSLSDRDITGHYGLFKNVAFYLDDTAGGIGSTEVASLLKVSLKCDNKIQPNYPGNQSGLYTSFNRDKRFVEVMIDLLLDAGTYTEFTDHYKDGDARFGSLVFAGAGNDLLTFNFSAAKWHKHEFKKTGPTRRITLMCQAAYDATLGYAWQMVCQNDIASL